MSFLTVLRDRTPSRKNISLCLLFAAMLGSSPGAYAGGLRDLDPQLRLYFLNHLLLLRAFNFPDQLAQSVLAYFLPTGLGFSAESQLTRDLDELWLEEEANLSYHLLLDETAPVIISANNGIHFSISRDELIQLQGLSPILARAMDQAPGPNIRLAISSPLLHLLLRLIREGAYTNLNFEAYTAETLEKLLGEASALECDLLLKKIKTFMSSKTGKLEKGHRHRHSTGRSQKSHSTRHRSATETSSPLYESPMSKSNPALFQLVKWSAKPEFQPLLCHYYPYIATDLELASFLESLDLDKDVNKTFALHLIGCFSADGFPNGIPPALLIKALKRKISQLNDVSANSKLLEQVLEAKLQHQMDMFARDEEYSVQHSELLVWDWEKYSDFEIAYAWTVTDAVRFRRMRPFEIRFSSSNLELQNDYFAIVKAFNNYKIWLVKEINKTIEKEPKRGSNDKTKLLKRLPKIAEIMIGLGNFHGAFIIYCVVRHSDFLLLLGHDPQKGKPSKDHNVLSLLKIFAPEKNFQVYRNQIGLLRESQGSGSYLSVMPLYGKDFAVLNELLEEEDEQTKALEIGNFFKQLYQDQCAANYENGARHELVEFFMELAQHEKQQI